MIPSTGKTAATNQLTMGGFQPNQTYKCELFSLNQFRQPIRLTNSSQNLAIAKTKGPAPAETPKIDKIWFEHTVGYGYLGNTLE